jgi:hypothetical protein
MKSNTVILMSDYTTTTKHLISNKLG